MVSISKKIWDYLSLQQQNTFWELRILKRAESRKIWRAQANGNWKPVYSKRFARRQEYQTYDYLPQGKSISFPNICFEKWTHSAGDGMPFKLESNLHIHFSLFWYDRVLRSEGHGLMITVAIRWQIQYLPGTHSFSRKVRTFLWTQ